MPLIFFVFGSIIGSFLNVVILRLNSGRTFKGRSECFSCGKKLSPAELIPILSFLTQNGRCRQCGSKISWQYPIVELITAVLFTLTYLYFEPISSGNLISFILTLIIFSILTVIAFYDLRHKIIPSQLSYLLVIFAFLFSISESRTFKWEDLAAGPIFFAIFAAIWLISRGRWMGFGDAKLVLGIGLFLGLIKGVSALVLAFWIGAAVGICALFLSGKKITMKSEIPFAPFLILGAILSFFLELDILRIGFFL